MADSAIAGSIAHDVERIVVASVAVTARALLEVAPELTFLQWRVLVVVDQPGGVSVGTVAVAVGAKPAAMSRLVGRLRMRGLVETSRGEEDARIVFVRLTERGELIRARIYERRRLEIREALDNTPLSPDATSSVNSIAQIIEAIALRDPPR